MRQKTGVHLLHDELHVVLVHVEVAVRVEAGDLRMEYKNWLTFGGKIKKHTSFFLSAFQTLCLRLLDMRSHTSDWYILSERKRKECHTSSTIKPK